MTCPRVCFGLNSGLPVRTASILLPELFPQPHVFKLTYPHCGVCVLQLGREARGYSWEVFLTCRLFVEKGLSLAGTQQVGWTVWPTNPWDPWDNACLVLGLQVRALAVYVGTGAQTQILTLVQQTLYKLGSPPALRISF